MSTSYGATPPGITGTHYGGADIGILGSLVPTEGLNGPGYLVGGNPAALLRGPITRWPAGTLVVYEDSGFTYTGPADFALYQLYEDGPASTTDIGYGPGIGRIELGVGAEGTLSGGVQLGGVDVAGGFGGGNASQLSGAVQLDAADAAGTLTGGDASQLGGSVALGDAVAAGSLGGVAMPVALAGYTVEARQRRASKPKALDVKDPDEVIHVLFDFRLIAATVAGVQLRITRFSGAADGDPSAIADGAPLVDGPRVFQRLDAGVDGCTYHLECQVDAPDGSRFVVAALLPVRSA